MKKLLVFTIFLLLMFQGKSQQNVLIKIDKDSFACFTRPICDSILTRLYRLEYFQEQTFNLLDQTKYQDSIISGYERQLSAKDKIITSYEIESGNISTIYKSQALQYSKLSGLYDKRIKRDKWLIPGVAVLGFLTGLIIMR